MPRLGVAQRGGAVQSGRKPPQQPVRPPNKVKVADAREKREVSCPLCIDPLDDTDKEFYPCPCGYQVCLFCYRKLINEYSGTCPGCRLLYAGDDSDKHKQHVERRNQQAQQQHVAQEEPPAQQRRHGTTRAAPAATARAAGQQPAARARSPAAHALLQPPRTQQQRAAGAKAPGAAAAAATPYPQPPLPTGQPSQRPLAIGAGGAGRQQAAVPAAPPPLLPGWGTNPPPQSAGPGRAVAVATAGDAPAAGGTAAAAADSGAVWPSLRYVAAQKGPEPPRHLGSAAALPSLPLSQQPAPGTAPPRAAPGAAALGTAGTAAAAAAAVSAAAGADGALVPAGGALAGWAAGPGASVVGGQPGQWVQERGTHAQQDIQQQPQQAAAQDPQLLQPLPRLPLYPQAQQQIRQPQQPHAALPQHQQSVQWLQQPPQQQQPQPQQQQQQQPPQQPPQQQQSQHISIEVCSVVGGVRHSACVPISATAAVAPHPAAPQLRGQLEHAVAEGQLSCSQAAERLLRMLRVDANGGEHASQPAAAPGVRTGQHSMRVLGCPSYGEPPASSLPPQLLSPPQHALPCLHSLAPAMGPPLSLAPLLQQQQQQLSLKQHAQPQQLVQVSCSSPAASGLHTLFANSDAARPSSATPTHAAAHPAWTGVPGRASPSSGGGGGGSSTISQSSTPSLSQPVWSDAWPPSLDLGLSSSAGAAVPHCLQMLWACGGSGSSGGSGGDGGTHLAAAPAAGKVLPPTGFCAPQDAGAAGMAAGGCAPCSTAGLPVYHAPPHLLGAGLQLPPGFPGRGRYNALGREVHHAP